MYEDQIIDINEYIDSIIRLTKNNTIIISEKELDTDKLEITGDLTCEPGKITKREFFYVSPKCHSVDGRRAIGLLLSELGTLAVYFEGDEMLLRDTIYNSLMGFAMVQSFTIYQLSIDRFIEQDHEKNFTYLLTREEYIPLALQIFSVVSEEDQVKAIQYTPLTLLKFPYTDKLPKYSILYLQNDEAHIESVDRNTLTELLYRNYDNVKKSLQQVLNDNPQLAKLIEKLKIY